MDRALKSARSIVRAGWMSRDLPRSAQVLVCWTSLVLLVPLAACDDTIASNYRTYEEALADNAVRRGWIPSYVPHSAVEILEIHDVSNNTQRLRFHAPVDDLREMVDTVPPVPRDQLPEYRGALPRAPWPWIDESNPGSEERSLEYFVLQPRDWQLHCLAIDWNRALVYAWTCRSDPMLTYDGSAVHDGRNRGDYARLKR
jgi:hypothetical protein